MIEVMIGGFYIALLIVGYLALLVGVPVYLIGLIIFITEKKWKLVSAMGIVLWLVCTMVYSLQKVL